MINNCDYGSKTYADGNYRCGLKGKKVKLLHEFLKAKGRREQNANTLSQQSNKIRDGRKTRH